MSVLAGIRRIRPKEANNGCHGADTHRSSAHRRRQGHAPGCAPQRQQGLSLVELILFMVVVGVALAAMLRVFLQATAASADPQIQRQALAIAESLMQEVQLMPFTYCDADDAQLETATSASVGASGCASLVNAQGPEAGETRYSSPQFDHVDDYDEFSMSAGIRDISNTPIAGLEAYSAKITVVPAALHTISSAGDALRITVSVQGPGGVQISLQGFRTRHAPNAAM